MTEDKVALIEYRPHTAGALKEFVMIQFITQKEAFQKSNMEINYGQNLFCRIINMK